MISAETKFWFGIVFALAMILGMLIAGQLR